MAWAFAAVSLAFCWAYGRWHAAGRRAAAAERRVEWLKEECSALNDRVTRSEDRSGQLDTYASGLERYIDLLLTDDDFREREKDGWVVMRANQEAAKFYQKGPLN